MEPNPRPSKSSWLEYSLLASPFVFLALFWSRFPARVPIHWGMHGIDGWASKGFGLLMLPVTNLFIYALILATPHLDPKIRRAPDEYERTLGIMRIVRLSVVVFFIGMFALQAATALGFPVPVERYAFNGCLILFMIMGNYLSGLRPNYFAGLRTPWTLENPETWRATHRLGGRIMFFGALILLIAQLFAGMSLWIVFFLIFIFGFALWTFIYSWNHARTHKQAH